jgi:hypothetical protein
MQVVRQAHFQRVRTQLAGRLLQAKTAFMPGLSEVLAAAAELRSVNFAAVSANHMYTLADYGELQVSCGGAVVALVPGGWAPAAFV